MTAASTSGGRASQQVHFQIKAVTGASTWIWLESHTNTQDWTNACFTHNEQAKRLGIRKRQAQGVGCI
eukprot:6193309-Pleurochrysis_carterae.AAC.1